MRNRMSSAAIASGISALSAFLAAAVPEKAQGGTFVATGSLQQSRFDHTATQLGDGKVLVAAGSSTYWTDGSAELYDPAAAAFTSTGNLVEARTQHTATLLPMGKVLVAGGLSFVPVPGYLWTTRSAELYDPATRSFSATSPLYTDRHYHTATLLPNGKVLLAGGHSYSGGDLATAELYDPGSGKFTPVTGTMSMPRAWHTATLLPNGKVLIAGGGSASSGTMSDHAELYDPEQGKTGAFIAIPALMTAPRGRHTATLLPNGKVLLAGGRTNPSWTLLDTAELYDPSTNSFASTAGRMTVARQQHVAALLPSGKVLVAGGSGYTYWGGVTPISAADLYDPAANAFASTGDMTTPRQSTTATLLSTNGKVLVSGGYPYADSPGTTAADLYGDPTLCY